MMARGAPHKEDREDVDVLAVAIVLAPCAAAIAFFFPGIFAVLTGAVVFGTFFTLMRQKEQGVVRAIYGPEPPKRQQTYAVVTALICSVGLMFVAIVWSLLLYLGRSRLRSALGIVCFVASLMVLAWRAERVYRMGGDGRRWILHRGVPLAAILSSLVFAFTNPEPELPSFWETISRWLKGEGRTLSDVVEGAYWTLYKVNELIEEVISQFLSWFLPERLAALLTRVIAFLVSVNSGHGVIAAAYAIVACPGHRPLGKSAALH